MEHCVVPITLLLFVWQWDSIFAAETDCCSCYSFHTTEKSWNESNQYCQLNGGNLVSMETEEEYQFINATIQSLDIEDNEWHIGLINSTRGWKWISGQSYTLTEKWLPGEPYGDGGHVKMIKEYNGLGLFNNIVWRRLGMFICEHREAKSCLNTKSITTNLCQETSPRKPVSLAMIGVIRPHFAVLSTLGTCYSFNTFRKNWTESNQYCQQNGGTLVSMETEDEYQFINKTIQSLAVEDNEWYIGLMSSIGDWKWTSGQIYHKDKFTNKSAPGEPFGDGNCVKMFKEYRGFGSLINVQCRLDYMFICEFKALDVAVSPGERKSCPETMTKKTTKKSK